MAEQSAQSKNKSRRIEVRLTDEEYRALDIRAAYAGLTRSEYLRQVALSDKTSFTNVFFGDSLKELVAANRQLVGVATNLNQIAHRLNRLRPGSISDDFQEQIATSIEATLEACEQTRDAIHEYLSHRFEMEMPVPDGRGDKR